jgi:hypothetical protein
VIKIIAGPTIVKPDVLSFGPSKLLETLHESSDAGLNITIILVVPQQHADTSDALRLPARRHRPRRRAA